MQRDFKTKTTIRFRQADPAQIMFFGNAFLLVHDAFEEFIQDIGYSWDDWFNSKKYMIPIRHTEADYLAPLLPGKSYDISVHVESFGQSSFVMVYTIGTAEKAHINIKMVHSVLDMKSKEKIKLPDEMKLKLGKYGPQN